ncbi:protein of unknown function [Shewanella benthica]|uniref:Uncharacterized protein n=1 Tax=Shewanella benthica TaxID=43661 RepID=A0A330M0N5_9GAMM|nr:protein of unknown function [Shewanella benthica]
MPVVIMLEVGFQGSILVLTRLKSVAKYNKTTSPNMLITTPEYANATGKRISME